MFWRKKTVLVEIQAILKHLQIRQNKDRMIILVLFFFTKAKFLLTENHSSSFPRVLHVNYLLRKYKFMHECHSLSFFFLLSGPFALLYVEKEIDPSYLLFFNFRDNRHDIKVGNAERGRVPGINIQH